MRRLAVAVLLFLFLLSTTLPGAATPLASGQTISLDYENPGLGGDTGLFDEFSQTFVIGANPYKQVIADLNNDSRPDIAVIYENSPILDIFFCDSQYKFNYANRTSVTLPIITDIAAGDMDKDGKMDLVVSCNVTIGNDVIILYQGNGFNKTLSPAISITFKPRGLVLQDFDNDTFLDIAALFSQDTPSYQPGFEVRLYKDGYNLNMFPVSLSGSPLSMQTPRLMISGDFNNDKKIDLIIGDHDVGRVVGYVNTGDGLTWTATTSFNISGPTSLMLRQIDKSTINPELVVGADTASKIEFRTFGTSSFSFKTEILNELMITSLAAIDLNNDATLDVVRASAQYHNLTIFNTPSSGLYSYSNSISFPTPYYPVNVNATDMDLNGWVDLVVISRSSSGNGAVTIYYRNTVTVSNANDNQIVKDISPGLSTIGDFNGDGSNELAVYDASQSKVRFVKEGMPNLANRTAPTNLSAMESADLNSDGYDDLIMVISNPASVRIWYGSSTFLSGGGSTVTVTSTLVQASSVTIGDLNNDTRIDLAVGGQGGVDIFWSSGSGTLYTNDQRLPLVLVGASVTSLTCGQLAQHLDGRLDLALVNASASRIEIYYQQAGGTKFVQSAHQFLNALSTIGKINASDMNSDGLADIVTSTTSTIHLYLQNSSYPKGFSEAQDIITLAIPEGVGMFDLGDLDDDGAQELAVATRNSTIMAYEFVDLTFVLMTRQTVGASPVMLMVDNMDSDPKDDLVAYSIPSRTISFFYQNNFPPTAAGHADGSGHLEGDIVHFNASQSSDSVSDLPTLNYTWSFGDTGIGYGKFCDHVYYSNGTFNVVLTVRDLSGLTDQTNFSVSIGDRGPTAIIDYTGTLIEGQPVQFNDLSTSYPDTIVKWNWTFGDGGTSAVKNPQHAFTGNGNYTVTLKVTDADGSTNSASIVMTISDSAPTSHFQISIPLPSEGQSVIFNDLSTFIVDPIVSWQWTFGDNTSSTLENPSHVYQNNGLYLVVLTVTDSDGSKSSSNATVTVLDTSPTIISLATSTGSTSFLEYDEIRLIVNAHKGWEDIDHYEWDFQTVTFAADDITTDNSTYHRYLSSGTYKMTVRAWDGDSYAEAYIMLYITDPAPRADFTIIEQDGGEVSFSAALSSDTENDQSILEYRWNFEGTWTSWNRSDEITHVFQRDGVFSVKLEVKDDHPTTASKNMNVTIDLLPPVITITDPVLKGEVGKPIVIHVNVTDVVGVESVMLEYTIDNITWTVAMTMDDPGSYFGQIPAQNHTTEISYRIIAEDRYEHVATTDPLVISVEYEDSTLFMLSSALLLLVLLGLLIYLFLSRPIVDEVFVMYHDGTLLAHQTRRLKPGMDDEILGGMLIALQNFVRDSFKDESSTVLSRMDFGEKKLLVERKDDFFLAVMLSGKRAGSAPQRMQKVLDNIEDNYAVVLREWDGDLEKVRGIRDDTKPMFQRANPLDRLKRKEGDGDSF